MFNNQELKRLRKECCLTQAGLAKETGISQQCISIWERGGVNPHPNNIKVLAEYFKIKPKQMFVRESK